MKYPYLPKLNRKVEVGEYFNIPLPNGDYAYWIILNKATENYTQIQIGLLNFSGKDLIIENRMYPLITQGRAHVKTIEKSGALIQGKIVAHEPVLELDASVGDCNVLNGFITLHRASSEEKIGLRPYSVYGYLVAQKMSLRYFK